MRFVITQSTCYTNRFWNWNCLNLRNSNSQRILTFDTSPTDIRMQVKRWTRFEKQEQQKHRSNTINITENVVYSQQQIPNSMAKHFKDNHSVGANTKHNSPVLWEFRLVLCHSSCSCKPLFDTWIQKVIVNNKQLKCQSVLSFEMNCNWIWKRVHANIIGVLTTIET